MSVSLLESRFDGWLDGWSDGHRAAASAAASDALHQVLDLRVGRPPGATASAYRDAATGTSAGPSDAEPDTADPVPNPLIADPLTARHDSLRTLEQVARERARLDAELVMAVHDVVDACRAGVLDEQGWLGIELSRSQAHRLEADTKRRAVTETQTLLGLRTREATTLVALAMARADVRAVVLHALQRGETSWPQVRKFWDAANSVSRQLTGDQKLLVGLSLFGSDPALAAKERLDPDGKLELGSPWPQAAFDAALTREITACEGTDVAAEREKRRRAYRARKARVLVHDDGTATLVLNGPVHKVLATHARHDGIARSLRRLGHEDSLAQLAADSMLATLTHAALDLPDPSSLDELSDADLDDLIAVVNGHPRVAMQVVVPADVLGIGHPVCATCAGDLSTPPAGAGSDQGRAFTGDRAASQERSACHPEEEPDVGVDDPGPPPLLPFARGGAPPGWAQSGTNDPVRVDEHDLDTDDGVLVGTHRHDGALVGFDPGLRRGRGLVGEILGSHPSFITPGQAREYFYTPGTTLHRILVDPADGRCLERTITTYRPDADMRRQVHAADVYSRYPASRLTGRSLEIDHVIPFGTVPGGVTTEPNLADLDKRTHKIKTLREITIATGARRDLTFTTLLGEITRSRVHDYGQYLAQVHPEDLDDRRDLANRVLYAAHAARPEHRTRGGVDAWLALDHTDPRTGERRPGPPEHVEDIHTLLGIPDDGAAPEDSPH